MILWLVGEVTLQDLKAASSEPSRLLVTKMATMLQSSLFVQCAVCYCLEARSAAVVAIYHAMQCNAQCIVQSMYALCAVCSLCIMCSAVCSLCIVCSGRCAAREKCATSYISGSNVLCHRLGRNNMLVRAMMCILADTYSPYSCWYMQRKIL